MAWPAMAARSPSQPTAGTPRSGSRAGGPSLDGAVAGRQRWLGRPASQRRPHAALHTFIAARAGRLEVVQWLARNGGSVNQPDNDGCTPVYVAAYNCYLELVQWPAGCDQHGPHTHTERERGDFSQIY